MNKVDYTESKPILKKDLKEKLIINGFKEGIGYKILKVINYVATTLDPPKVGETFYIEYDFKPHSLCYCGYEHLCLNIYRNKDTEIIPNFVKYFYDIETLVDYLNNFELVLDKEKALEKIQRLEKQILEIKRDYEL